MKRKLPVLIFAVIILLQLFSPAVFAVSKNEAESQTASFCSFISLSEIHDFCDDINKAKDGISYDWDEWSCEDWITVTVKNKKVAMIGIKIPVAFVKISISEYIQSFELMRKLHVVTINDFDDIMWTLDLNTFKNVFPDIEWHASDDAVDTTSFSTNDFWFATI